MAPKRRSRKAKAPTECPAEHLPLVDCLARFAKKPDFIEYGTGMAGARTSKTGIMKYDNMWRAMKQETGSIPTLTKAEAKLVATTLYDRVKDTWKRHLSKEELQTWLDSIPLRLRTMSRHLNQALLKNTKWAECMFKDQNVGDLLAGRSSPAKPAKVEDGKSRPKWPSLTPPEPAAQAEAAGSAQPGGSSSSAPTGQDVVCFGWEAEMLVAWKEIGKSPREYSLPVDTDGLDPESHPTATFKDGSTKVITNLTVGELVKLKSGCRDVGGRWKSKCNNFIIVYRADRAPCLILQDRSGPAPVQMCMVKLHSYGDPEQQVFWEKCDFGNSRIATGNCERQ